jgi:DUF971 family protein
MAALIPANITLNQATGHLIINWSDGRGCHYPVSQLRLACPCVECRGGHERMGRQYDPEKLVDLIPERNYQIDRLEIVGNYALQFYWNDGHHTGIYTWDYLSRLCPAEEPYA